MSQFAEGMKELTNVCKALMTC